MSFDDLFEKSNFEEEFKETFKKFTKKVSLDLLTKIEELTGEDQSDSKEALEEMLEDGWKNLAAVYLEEYSEEEIRDKFKPAQDPDEWERMITVQARIQLETGKLLQKRIERIMKEEFGEE